MRASASDRAAALVAAATLTLGLAACSDEDRQSLEDDARAAASDVGDAVRDRAEEVAEEVAEDAAELIARNFVAEQAPALFADAGHPLAGELSCQASADGPTDASVTCTGTTVAGGAAVLSASAEGVSTESIGSLDGTFVGTVDGEQVFSADNLGR